MGRDDAPFLLMVPSSFAGGLRATRSDCPVPGVLERLTCSSQGIAAYWLADLNFHHGTSQASVCRYLHSSQDRPFRQTSRNQPGTGDQVKESQACWRRPRLQGSDQEHSRVAWEKYGILLQLAFLLTPQHERSVTRWSCESFMTVFISGAIRYLVARMKDATTGGASQRVKDFADRNTHGLTRHSGQSAESKIEHLAGRSDWPFERLLELVDS